MGKRHKARRLALQFLFQVDSTGGDLESALERFKTAFGLDEDLSEFFLGLVDGVLTHKDELDQAIEGRSTNWRLSRMARVDRNILRLAVYEMTHRQDVPDKVAINEAIELAKDFGTDESGSFINGILDSIRKGRVAPGGTPKQE